MTLAQFRDWLKIQVDCPKWYIGKIDSKQEKCIGIYGLPGPPPVVALGGLDNTTTVAKTISILIHWGSNSDAAEKKAKEVYQALLANTEAVINGRRVILFHLRSSEPVAIGTDDRNIYEYVVETTIIYER